MLTRVMQMLQSTKTQSRVTFGLFEADLKSGELWKAGYRIKLQGLPFKVLTILLENAGEVVTREEFQTSVWGPDVIVDFEHSLSNAIKKLREALGDSADNPRFIETLSRRGFRFIAPVGFTETPPHNNPASLVDEPAASPIPVTASISSASAVAPKIATAPLVRRWLKYMAPAVSFGLGGLLIGAAVQFRNARKPLEPLPRMSQITQDGAIYASKDHLLGALSTFVTDGTHIFTPSTENGEVVLSQISMATGERQSFPVPSELGAPDIKDISPDGTKLLVRSNLASAALQPLWVIPIDGGSAFRISNVLVQDATWMPDGKSILYASGNQLATVSLENGKSTAFATVAGRAFWPRWSPDGKLLRFTIIDAVNHTSSLWEISEGQSVARPVLKTWNKSANECCGVWTADGKFFVFEATREGHADLWKVNASLDSNPSRVTNGPLDYKAPLAGRTGQQIFFVGQDIHSRLERYNSELKEYVPQQGFLAAADHITFSNDGRWVAWVDLDHRVWRSQVDGADKVLLTPASMHVYMAAWSPDNTQLALMSREPGQPWQIYTVSANGGSPEHLLQENRNLGDPSFSPDGKYLVFGMVPELMGQGKAPIPIKIVELTTHRVTEVPQSEGLFSPRWSPDGNFIAALTLDQKRVMLYDTKTQIWKTLAVTSAALPVWSRDSKALYIHAYKAENKPIYRVSVPDGQMKEIAGLNNFRVDSVTHADFAGITLDGTPLMHTEISSGNLYALDLKSR
jgi:Tol biopolymer transport system component/DNA-binding winged helix-turn-helix (wHTH) protein